MNGKTLLVIGITVGISIIIAFFTFPLFFSGGQNQINIDYSVTDDGIVYESGGAEFESVQDIAIVAGDREEVVRRGISMSPNQLLVPGTELEDIGVKEGETIQISFIDSDGGATRTSQNIALSGAFPGVSTEQQPDIINYQRSSGIELSENITVLSNTKNNFSIPTVIEGQTVTYDISGQTQFTIVFNTPRGKQIVDSGSSVQGAFNVTRTGSIDVTVSGIRGIEREIVNSNSIVVERGSPLPLDINAEKDNELVLETKADRVTNGTNQSNLNMNITKKDTGEEIVSQEGWNGETIESIITGPVEFSVYIDRSNQRWDVQYDVFNQRNIREELSLEVNADDKTQILAYEVNN